MQNVCFFLMSGLPIPATKGGAIETLLQLFINENEIYKRLYITILCTYDEEAEKESEKYKYTKFVYFKSLPGIDRFTTIGSRVLYRGTRLSTPNTIACLKALKYLRKHQDFDIVINETWRVYLAPLLALSFPRNKIAMHIHRKGEQSKGDISNKIDRSFKYLITVSDFVANDWIANTARTNELVYTLKNCCNSESLRRKLDENEKIELRESLGIKTDEIVIIFAGRITAEKGVVELISALNKVKSTNLHLLLVGGNLNKQEHKSNYEQKVDELINTCSVKVTRTGYIANNELYRYYNIADFTVLPSMCPDAAPLTVIEAMTAGMPIITTEKGGIPEYACADISKVLPVNDDFLNILANTIDMLAHDISLRKEMSQNAKNEAMKYTPRQYYDEFLEIIYEMTK